MTDKQKFINDCWDEIHQNLVEARQNLVEARQNLVEARQNLDKTKLKKIRGRLKNKFSKRLKLTKKYTFLKTKREVH